VLNTKKRYVNPLKTPSQTKVLTGGGDLREAQVDKDEAQKVLFKGPVRTAL